MQSFVEIYTINYSSPFTASSSSKSSSSRVLNFSRLPTFSLLIYHGFFSLTFTQSSPFLVFYFTVSQFSLLVSHLTLLFISFPPSLLYFASVSSFLRLDNIFSSTILFLLLRHLFRGIALTISFLLIVILLWLSFSPTVSYSSYYASSL